jgi:hypothetical protein
MHKIEEEHQELEKQREREELRKDPDAIVKQYRAARFICHPRCGFVADRRDEAAIISHKSQCGWCIEAREEREKQLALARDGHMRMGYVLGMLEKYKQDIKNLKQKIDREKKEKMDNYQFVIQMTQAKIGETQSRLEKEQMEMHKLLNDSNEITRSAAKELYERYLHASESARRRDQY